MLNGGIRSVKISSWTFRSSELQLLKMSSISCSATELILIEICRYAGLLAIPTVETFKVQSRSNNSEAQKKNASTQNTFHTKIAVFKTLSNIIVSFQSKQH